MVIEEAEAASSPATGSCLCGGVSFELRGALRGVVNCHCGQCRKTHGHVAAYTNITESDLVLTRDDTLRWYASTPGVARRGFCERCGASLFWKRESDPAIGIAAGTLDAPTGLQTIGHIYVADAGDYYDLEDGLEQLPRGHDSGNTG